MSQYNHDWYAAAHNIGKGNVTRRIDVIASLLTLGGTLEDLKEIELCYSPIGMLLPTNVVSGHPGLSLCRSRLRKTAKLPRLYSSSR